MSHFFILPAEALKYMKGTDIFLVPGDSGSDPTITPLLLGQSSLWSQPDNFIIFCLYYHEIPEKKEIVSFGLMAAHSTTSLTSKLLDCGITYRYHTCLVDVKCCINKHFTYQSFIRSSQILIGSSIVSLYLQSYNFCCHS